MVGEFFSGGLGQIMDHDKPLSAFGTFLCVLTQQITMTDDCREFVDQIMRHDTDGLMRFCIWPHMGNISYPCQKGTVPF